MYNKYLRKNREPETITILLNQDDLNNIDLALKNTDGDTKYILLTIINEKCSIYCNPSITCANQENINNLTD